MDRDLVDVAERLAPYEARHVPLDAWSGPAFDGLLWLEPDVDLRDPEPEPAAR